jgi:opacity protein-like surface antigen
VGFEGSVSGNVGWSASNTIASTLTTTTTTDAVTLNLQDQAWRQHSIGLNFYYDNEIADGLKIGVFAAIPMTITRSIFSSTYNHYFSTSVVENNHADFAFLNRTTNVEYIETPNSTDITSFNIVGSVDFGATYALTERFTINAGINLTPVNYTHRVTRSSTSTLNATATTTVLDAAGNVISTDVVLIGPSTSDTVTDSVQVQDEWNYFAFAAAGGFRFNFSENMAIDMAIVGGNSSAFELELTSVRALLTLKF